MLPIVNPRSPYARRNDRKRWPDEWPCAKSWKATRTGESANVKSGTANAMNVIDATTEDGPTRSDATTETEIAADIEHTPLSIDANLPRLEKFGFTFCHLFE